MTDNAGPFLDGKFTFRGFSLGASSRSLFRHFSINVNRPTFPVACAKANTTSCGRIKRYSRIVNGNSNICAKKIPTWQVVVSVTPQTILWIPSTQTLSSMIVFEERFEISNTLRSPDSFDQTIRCKWNQTYWSISLAFFASLYLYRNGWLFRVSIWGVAPRDIVSRKMGVAQGRCVSINCRDFL